jgi:subtilisin family serine protease
MVFGFNGDTRRHCVVSQLGISRSVVAAFASAVSLLFIAPASAETMMVVSGQYIIQRKPNHEQKTQTAVQGQYLVHSASRFSELVIAKSAQVARTQASAIPHHEPLDWSKVRDDCDEIMKDSSIRSCEPNIVLSLAAVPNDQYFHYQWGLNDPSAYDADVRMQSAWDQGTGSKDILIGVIDSGVYGSHPDLAANLWSNPGEVVDGVDNDGNGYADDIHGINGVTQTGDPTDCNGHGTHVSGIIGAVGNNSIGVTGVNWIANMIVARVGPDCGNSIDLNGAIAAYDYFYGLKQMGHNIRVINASFGGSGFSQASYDAISRLNAADIVLVAAAGNSSTNVDASPFYPAGFDLPNIVSVGATGPTLAVAPYTNYGQSVDIAAPGGDVRYEGGGSVSTWTPLSPEAPALYREIQGTSMAAPVVTGAIGLLASQRPLLTGLHLIDIALQTADSINSLNGAVAGARFLNVAAMVGAANPTDTCPSDPNKLAPGACGCGVVDSYADSDSDGSFDCVDACPTNGAKTSAGVCGCGASDADANGNGFADCLDPAVQGVKPPAPRVRALRGAVAVSMAPKDGVKYLAKVVTRLGKRKSKTTHYAVSSANGRITKLQRGAIVTVSYAYYVDGTTRVVSEFSKAKTVRVG